MLLVRFLAAVLFVLAFIVLAYLIDTVWVIVLAVLVLLVALVFVDRTAARYFRSEEWLGPEEEAELAREHRVEHETGLPVGDRRSRRDRKA